MIEVPASFAAMPRWWSDAPGRAWLDELPSIVEQRCARWGLAVDGPPRHGSNALVVPVRRGGEPLALRLAPPGDDVATESAALAHWNGRGTVRLLDADIPERVMLLERLDADRSLLDLPVLDALAVLGSLTAELAVAAPDGVPSTADLAAESVSTFPVEWAELAEPVGADIRDRAVEHAASLALSPDASRSVDGDLHFAQVLAGTRMPWIVVDPVLLRGDREYDIGRALWTRLDELPDDADVHRGFDAFVTAAGAPEERARSWVVVRSMSYLLWGLRRGLTWDPPKCVRLLALFA